MIHFIPLHREFLIMKIVNVEVASDLYKAGVTEDGQDYIAENYFVVVEYANGEVFRHTETFLGCRVEEAGPEDEDWGCVNFADVRLEAQAKAERLCARVQEAVVKGRTLDERCWHFYRTIYGSGAYLQEVAEQTPRQRAGEPD
jgi:hypothetical protein